MKSPTLEELPSPPKGKSGWPWTSESHNWSKQEYAVDWPKISIVTPSYNTGTYLEATIRSVLLQGYPNYEYIVIDGGSGDGSKDIINKYSNWISNWISEKDRGQYFAIQKGFDLSKGEVLCWLNSDDMFFPDGLSIIGSIMCRYNGKIDWITGIPCYWDYTGNRFSVNKRSIAIPKFMIKIGGHDGRSLQFIMQECTFWRKSLWLTAGNMINTKYNYAADFELWKRFASFSKLYFVEGLIAANRNRPGQKTECDMAYYKEVDMIQRDHKLFSFLNFPPIKYSLRLFFQYLLFSNTVYYDVTTMEWRIRKFGAK